MKTTLIRLIALVLTLIALLDGGPLAFAADELASLEGHVTLDGKPLESGRIIFHQADGQFFGSKIKKEGKFKMDRIPAGSYRVTVESKGVPEKYTSDENSPLTVEVKSGSNVINFDLASK